VLQAAPLWRGLAQQYQCIALQNFLKGWSPGKILPLDPCENRGEDNMPRGTLSENLT
jgi:hypothetical protein